MLRQVDFKCILLTMFFDILCLFVLLVDPLGSIWLSFREPKGDIKAPFSPDVPRRVSGRDSGVIFGGFKTYFGCIFGSVFDDFLLCSSSVFDMGDV